MKNIIAFLLLFAPCGLCAQFEDSFSDKDFSKNPIWSGSTDKFIVNDSEQLQLNAPKITSSAYLSTSSKAIDNASWQFYLKAGLLLTSANYVNFYLVSDSVNLSGSLNGYYIMIGNTDKSITLYRQQGSSRTKLIGSQANRLPISGNATEVIVKVTRDTIGNWALYSKLPKDTNFVLEGMANDITMQKSCYSGIFCKYSSTNSANYAFDDFKVTGTSFEDRVPLSVVSYRMINQTQLEIVFSKDVSLQHAQFQFAPLLNYQTSLSENHLLITFDHSIPTRESYSLTLLQIEDLAGNVMLPDTLSFGLFPISFGDVIFNELMVNPAPSVSLPEVQYIELYNRCSFPISLHNWTLTYGSKHYIINDGVISPYGYLLLCNPSNHSILTTYGDVAAMESFPSMAKSGQMLSLMNDQDSLIAFVNYSNTWYKDDFQQSGGWSLECIDPSNLSGNALNWKASENQSGGTPGKINSVLNDCPDQVQPSVLSASLFEPDTLTLTFNKPMLLSDLYKSTKYEFSDGLTADVLDVEFPQGTWVRLLVNGNMYHGSVYTVSIHNLSDVNQHVLQQALQFGLPDSCDKTDVVINEILSHPKSTGASFVELYNRSEKLIDLKDLWLNRITSTGKRDAGYPVCTNGYQLFPGKYVVLTTSKQGITSNYSCADSTAFIEMNSFPSLPNASGNVLLVNRSGMVIDSVEYNESEHDPMIQDPTGVSFERVSPDENSNLVTNWHSASSTVGYATPSYRNSQYKDVTSTSVSHHCFWFDQDFFTPDNDGSDDLLWIHYALPDVGYSATMTIYDAIGRRIRQLTNNALLGTKGSISWNGRADNGTSVNVGVYVIYIDAVQPLAGKRIQAKLPCALTAK
ncbi:lamin tail domain-containing protein [Microbacter margulisiae]|uniref:LTD domain-containing protein n=1 Tax=Microbacter margulisiae TaxID=1350067 RepID=A0A7W5DQS5_9PORP|nr:lamin tail domain-containing protein [Microbacter margulisiae]MBB3186849.1 hypothetical protein [Microbacter margulisiae]